MFLSVTASAPFPTGCGIKREVQLAEYRAMIKSLADAVETAPMLLGRVHHGERRRVVGTSCGVVCLCIAGSTRRHASGTSASAVPLRHSPTLVTASTILSTAAPDASAHGGSAVLPLTHLVKHAAAQSFIHSLDRRVVFRFKYHVNDTSFSFFFDKTPTPAPQFQYMPPVCRWISQKYDALIHGGDLQIIKFTSLY